MANISAYTRGDLVFGQYTAAGVTLADGDRVPLQFDSTGNLKTTGSGGGGGTVTQGAQAGASAGNTWFVQQTGALPAGTNVIGHVIIDTGSTTAVTALPAIPTGSNTIGGTTLVATSVTPTDKGGTMTAGGTSQTLAATNASRKSLVIQNPATATENLYVAVVGSATVNSSGNFAELVPGGSCTVWLDGFIYTGAVTVNAATTGHRYIATEFA